MNLSQLFEHIGWVVFGLFILTSIIGEYHTYKYKKAKQDYFESTDPKLLGNKELLDVAGNHIDISLKLSIFKFVLIVSLMAVFALSLYFKQGV